MYEQERLTCGRAWVAEILFQVAEEYHCLVDGFRFIPVDEGLRLLFNLNGNVVSCVLPSSEIENFAEEGTFRNKMRSSRSKIKQQFRVLLMLHKRGISIQS